MRILMIEDSPRLTELVGETLRGAGYAVDTLSTLAEGREALALAAYDLLLLDLGLPDGDGLEILRQLRDGKSALPVLVLTARGAVDERITGLDLGADDYLVKPFNNGELLARIRAMLRRSPQAVMPELAFGGIALQLATGQVTCGTGELALAPRERAVLEMLLRSAGQVVLKRKIEHAFSEFGDERSANAVELAVSRLRKKLEAGAPSVAIETIRGVGYMLRELGS